MKLKIESDQPITDEAAKAATGKTLTQWFAELDRADALKLGRAAAHRHLAAHKVDVWWSTTIAVEYEKLHGARKKDGLFEGYAICSTKTVAAPIGQVFEAWSGGEALSRWFGETTKAETRDGGAHHSRDGHQGVFLRVRKDKDLRLTFEGAGLSAPTQVDVQFSDKGKGKTGLIVNHTRVQTRAEADGLRRAWADALDQLKAICEG